MTLVSLRLDVSPAWKQDFQPMPLCPVTPMRPFLLLAFTSQMARTSCAVSPTSLFTSATAIER